MSKAQPTKFTENDTGEIVDVFVPYPFGSGLPVVNVVTYASGRTFWIVDDVFNKLFTIVSPQEVFIEAYGGIHERPTRGQVTALQLMSASAAATIAKAEEIPDREHVDDKPPYDPED